MVRILEVYLIRQSFFVTFFCSRVFVATSFWFYHPYLFLELFLLGLQSAGCPILVSLLYWFWLFGLFIYEFFDNDCLSLRLFGTITVFLCSVRTSLVPFIMHLDQLRELPCPRLWLRVLIFEKKTSYFFGSKGLTSDYLPYNSSV